MAGSWTPSAAGVCASILCATFLLASVLVQPTEAKVIDPVCGTLPAPLPKTLSPPCKSGPFVVAPTGTTVPVAMKRCKTKAAAVPLAIVFEKLCNALDWPTTFSIYINNPKATLGTGTGAGTGFVTKIFKMRGEPAIATYSVGISGFLDENQLMGAKALNVTIVPSKDMSGAMPFTMSTRPVSLKRVAAVAGKVYIEYSS